MTVKTITQIRNEYPSVTLSEMDLFLVDKSTKTVAVSLGEVKSFVTPEIATDSSDGLLSANDKAKLDEIPVGATANQTDEYLLNRGYHIGTQPMATIEGLVDSLNSKLERVFVGDVDGLQNALNEVNNKLTTNETNISQNSSKIQEHDETIQNLESSIQENQSKIQSIEGEVSGLSPKENPVFTGVIKIPTYQKDSLPSSSDNEGALVIVSDATGGPTLAIANSNKWIVLAASSGQEVE